MLWKSPLLLRSTSRERGDLRSGVEYGPGLGLEAGAQAMSLSCGAAG
jgi:hypothetical protein